MHHMMSNLTLPGTCMYVADYSNGRVQVMDTSDQFIRVFGWEGEGKLGWPSSLYIADKYVYVSDQSGDCILEPLMNNSL